MAHSSMLKIGTSALAGGALVLTGVAGAPAATAASGTINYNCTTLLGNKVFASVSDTNLPTTMRYGQPANVTVNASVTVPSDLASAAYNLLGARSAEGTAKPQATLMGKAHTVDATIASTPVTQGPLQLKAVGKPVAVRAMTMGKQSVTAGNFTATIIFKKADSSTAHTENTTCTMAAGQANLVDQVTVIKDSTKTKAPKPKAKKKKVLKAKVSVSSTYGTAVTGKAKAVLYRGTKKVSTKTVSVKGGNGVAKFGKLKKAGAYKLKVTYLGSTTLSKSSVTTKFKVK